MPSGPKLRAHVPEKPLHVVLVEPEIPPNTGAVSRTCAATQSPLHLVHPLGFRIDEHSVRRAGIDYWSLLDLRQHETFKHFEDSFEGGQIHLFSANATKSYLEADIRPGDAVVFGKESSGLPQSIVERYPQTTWAIPMMGEVRCLNLSNAVAVVLYEALRSSGSLDKTFVG